MPLRIGSSNSAEQHQAARANHAEISSQATAFEREWQEASRKFDALDWERTTLDQQLRASAERVEQLEHEAAEQRKFLTQARTRQRELQSLVESERLRDDELADQLRELQLSVATERQRHEGLCTQRQPMTVRQAELEELIATRRSDIANYEARLGQQAAENAAAEKRSKRARQLFPRPKLRLKRSSPRGPHDWRRSTSSRSICVLVAKNSATCHETRGKKRFGRRRHS